ncbi:biotin transporter BioY [Candidatus Desantisbacteria bacterium CG_4_10_14_0_8_um_filter_48_22]|uniref:Biotin transporter n=1 Tax=Candidatus Desantisbacteria bacterium CG_4_10_14_0_8_um_filter_48_22 TaxID=1974543 RepID=A0A2M7S6X5_9BACT|nr:MAG: hypothetical protein AUJ67_01320 [Candidatus Desantisbacteria bacterium CG1_02_49_89]PIV57191.1 MAG: biotin transporter BioY [Candidatus Desantisbacteria bacterium CG02_land_8_20_14_3_00_49_13]PIZ15210.1 MAG: biotin transporter BioY [Candidatus Desantisbacteria bacterium CG_4_10_14_0_8_um_filter_48_22]PJB28424.1 MAG: biotin transporter BioY [Candidatus Desantisbacteria bacterium CG_4_9_14_3_um_filter_50_7]
MTERIMDLRYEAFAWRESRGIAGKLMLSVCFAGITGLLAGIRIPLPFTPVPITGQVLGVFLGSIFLGRKYGGISQIFYVFLGLCGIPWFAGWKAVSFYQFLSSPTAGYLVGFVFAGFYLGDIADRKVGNRFFPRQILAMLSATLIYYACGTVHLALLMKLDLQQALAMGVLPFIAVDLVKAVIAASVSSALLPKKSFTTESDR